MIKWNKEELKELSKERKKYEKELLYEITNKEKERVKELSDILKEAYSALGKKDYSEMTTRELVYIITKYEKMLKNFKEYKNIDMPEITDIEVHIVPAKKLA